jgi:glutamate-ammonia-ligase adenylyltransferase
MSRPAGSQAIRYGLSDSPRITEDLGIAGLSDPTDPETATVLGSVSRTARPELTVTTLARLLTAAGPAQAQQIITAVRTERTLRARLLAVLGGSAALGEHLVANPTQWSLLRTEAVPHDLLDPAEIRRTIWSAVDLDPDAPPCTGTSGGRAGRTGPAAINALRSAYRSVLLVIAGHDLVAAVDASLPIVALPAVCRSLSDLADATLQAALSMAAAALPASAPPTRLGVIAMGKCGARELNYVSDLDVIFIADHDDPVGPDGPAPRNADQSDGPMLATATRLASGLMRICGQVAWEVDAGLRPEGKTGPLVRTPASHAAYYQRWAHTWEFQAMLKARPAAGDLLLGGEFTRITAPGVWSAAGRESFVYDVQAMRRRVEQNIPDAYRDRELKLGAGGLRDVEFAVQLLQLVHGRTDADLRGPGTLTALRALIRGGYVGRSDGAEMAAAYTFLRRTEHRLQLQRLRRTHLLPDNRDDLEWVARADGYTASGTADAAEVFTGERLRHASVVRRLHEKLFYRPLLHAVAAVPDDELRLSPEAARARLAALGFASPESALRHIAALTTGVSRRAAIQRTLLPVLLGTFSASPDPDGGLLAYRQVSEALASTPWYLRFLRDEGTVAQRLAGLLGESKLVGDLMTRAPEVLRLLADDGALLAVDPSTVASALRARARRAGSAEESAGAARSARRHELLRLACGDLLGLIDVHTVTRSLTSITQATVQAALVAAIGSVTRERGGFPARLAVIGMGRLGGAELNYYSDADVMYVAEPLGAADQHDALTAATAAADLMARLLGRPSPDPALVIDAALRPEGRNGPLVRTLDSYRKYWERFAAPWERQALIRARPFAGDAELGAAFIAAADPIRYPERGLTQAEVVEIRRIKARVDAERLPRGADPTTHTKLGRGGLSDVEWTVQLLQLRHAGVELALRVPSTLPAIAAAVEVGLLDEDDASALTAGWEQATRVRNAITLVRAKAEDQIPRQGRPLAAVAMALGYPAGSDPGQFVDDYRRTARHARRVVDRLFDQG